MLALRQDVVWRISQFYEFKENVSYLNDYDVSFWEGEENWAVLSSGDDMISYVWHRYPLVFVIKGYRDQFPNDDFIVYVECDNFDKEEYKLDYTLFTDYLEYGMDYSKFSVHDLWFQNNSI